MSLVTLDMQEERRGGPSAPPRGETKSHNTFGDSDSMLEVPDLTANFEQNAQRSGPGDGAGGVKFDFEELDAEILEMERKAKLQMNDDIQSATQSISDAKTPWAQLPSQGPESVDFHKKVLEAYGKSRHIKGLNPKKQFMARKQKAREARRVKKAESVKARTNTKSESVIRRKKNRRKAVY